jgi:RNA polymerase sigma-70 factor (ECF subfamily)
VDLSRLLERCRVGEPAAIETLVRTHQDAVYRLAYSLLGDPAEADEAAQDTFLAALKSLASYRGEAAFATWLYAVTVNVCRMRRRRLLSWTRLKQTLTAGLRLSASPVGPEAAVLQSEADAALWKAVQALGEKHRLPILLRYYHGLTVDEIAQVLGVKAGTIHSRLSTARDRLRVALKYSPAFSWAAGQDP